MNYLQNKYFSPPLKPRCTTTVWNIKVQKCCNCSTTPWSWQSCQLHHLKSLNT